MTQVSLFTLSAILLGLATFVWRARPDSSVNRWFAAFTVFVAFWVTGVAGLQSGTHLNAWGRFTFASACLIPASFLGFIHLYPTTSVWSSPKLRRWPAYLGIALAILSLFTPFMVYDNVMTPAGLERKTGPLYPLFSLYFILAWTVAFGLFISKWRAARGLARAQLQHLGAGILLSAAGGMLTNLLVPLLTGKSTYSWIGPYFGLLLVTMVGHAIIRHRLLDLRVVISRGLAYTLIMGALSGGVILAGSSFVEDWSSKPIVVAPYVAVIGFVVLLMLTSPVRWLFDYWLDPYLYRGRIDYASALRHATHRLTRLMEPRELSDEVRSILTAAFVPESFAMVARPPDGDALEELSADAPTATALMNLALPLLERGHTSVFLVDPASERGVRRGIHDALRRADVEIVIVLARRDELQGAVFLGPRRSGDAYFTRDLAFIESLAELASVALENSLLYRQRIRILEYSDRLLESLNSAVVAVDVAGRITSSNPAAASLLGLRPENRGASLSALPSEVGWALAIALTGNWLPRELEVTIDYRTGGFLPVILSTAVLHDQGTKIAGALVVVTDLSAVKALERNQRRVEHFATMARFYAGIAHEIRSPLGAISNFIAMLPDRFDDQEYRETAGRLLPIEVGRIVRLADRLRLMAPSEGGTLSPTDLAPLLHDLVAIHAPAAGESNVKIVLDCPDELPHIQGDQAQLVQLFVNLLRNGVEAMPSGGSLTIHCYPSGDQQSVVADVIDEGLGIDASLRNKIFEPFFTTKASGTGLGLAICKEIADFHRARLSLESRGGQTGTVARVEFSVVAREGSSDMTQSSRRSGNAKPSSQP